jgi:hypothetical protein
VHRKSANAPTLVNNVTVFCTKMTKKTKRKKTKRKKTKETTKKSRERRKKTILSKS